MHHLCHPCSAKPSTLSSDSNVQQAYNRSQERRYQQLKQNVHDSLVKPPPDTPLPSQKGSCGTYVLSKEEAHNDVSKYEAKMRTHRMLQVRAQEMLFASHQVEDFRNCKAKDKHQLLNYLKEIWENDQRKRIASLEEEFVTSCKSIGLSHDAAIMVQRNWAAKEELKSRQAAESRCWDALRFEEALQKERVYRKEREREAKAAEARRKQSDLVARNARTLVRPQSSPKPNETDASDDSRKTYVSSRCHVLRDRTNRHSSPSLSQPSHEDTHAWQCVDAQHGSNTSMRACQAEVCHIHSMRKHHEERTAKASSQHDKRFYDGLRTGGPELLSHKYMLFPPDNSSFVRLKMNRPASCPGMYKAGGLNASDAFLKKERKTAAADVELRDSQTHPNVAINLPVGRFPEEKNENHEDGLDLSRVFGNNVQQKSCFESPKMVRGPAKKGTPTPRSSTDDTPSSNLWSISPDRGPKREVKPVSATYSDIPFVITCPGSESIMRLTKVEPSVLRGKQHQSDIPGRRRTNGHVEGHGMEPDETCKKEKHDHNNQKQVSSKRCWPSNSPSRNPVNEKLGHKDTTSLSTKRRWSEPGLLSERPRTVGTRPSIDSKKRKAKSPQAPLGHAGNTMREVISRPWTSAQNTRSSLVDWLATPSGDDERMSVVESVKEYIREDVYRHERSSPALDTRDILYEQSCCLTGVEQGRKERNTTFSSPRPFTAQDQQEALTVIYGAKGRAPVSHSWKETVMRWEDKGAAIPRGELSSKSNLRAVVSASGSDTSSPKMRKRLCNDPSSCLIGERELDYKIWKLNQVKGFDVLEKDMGHPPRLLRKRATWKKNDLHLLKRRAASLRRSHEHRLKATIFSAQIRRCRSTPSSPNKREASSKPPYRREDYVKAQGSESLLDRGTSIPNNRHLPVLPGLDLVNVGENKGTNVGESASFPIHSKMDIAKVGQSKTLQDVGQSTARDVADKLINAWVTGRYNSEFYKAMKKATRITGERNPPGENRPEYPGRPYLRPWLSQADASSIGTPPDEALRQATLVDQNSDTLRVSHRRHNGMKTNDGRCHSVCRVLHKSGIVPPWKRQTIGEGPPISCQSSAQSHLLSVDPSLEEACEPRYSMADVLEDPSFGRSETPRQTATAHSAVTPSISSDDDIDSCTTGMNQDDASLSGETSSSHYTGLSVNFRLCKEDDKAVQRRFSATHRQSPLSSSGWSPSGASEEPDGEIVPNNSVHVSPWDTGTVYRSMVEQKSLRASPTPEYASSLLPNQKEAGRPTRGCISREYTDALGIQQPNIHLHKPGSESPLPGDKSRLKHSQEKKLNFNSLRKHSNSTQTQLTLSRYLSTRPSLSLPSSPMKLRNQLSSRGHDPSLQCTPATVCGYQDWRTQDASTKSSMPKRFRRPAWGEMIQTLVLIDSTATSSGEETHLPTRATKLLARPFDMDNKEASSSVDMVFESDPN